MHILLVGLNHRSAPIELRERLAFSPELVPSALGRLRHECALPEAAILSTCNRVEIYAAVPELNGTVSRVHRFLSDHARLSPEGLAPSLYSLTEPHSIRHLFSVASGLDSMVLGEAEILQQVKRAYELALEHGATGKAMNGLFQRALNTAKAVRQHTGIGRGGTSVGTVAVELSQKIFGGLGAATVLLIGAGKIGELTVRRLTERGVRRVRIMNRSLDRAAALASAYAASAVGLSQLEDELLHADIVISSTSAPGYVLRTAEVEQAMRGRRQRPLCLVDLGVPRNIEPSVGGLENVYLFDIDDLQGLAAQHQSERAEASVEAQGIIDQKVELFLAWRQAELLRAPGCGPTFSAPAAAR